LNLPEDPGHNAVLHRQGLGLDEHGKLPLVDLNIASIEGGVIVHYNKLIIIFAILGSLYIIISLLCLLLQPRFLLLQNVLVIAGFDVLLFDRINDVVRNPSNGAT
jgi:hypothetical protein